MAQHNRGYKIEPNEILIDEIYIDNIRYLRYYHGDMPTRYFVSELGTVYSEVNGFIKVGTTLKGYKKISMFTGTKNPKPVTVHKMVAWTFHRDQWRPGYDVDHLDGVKSNNRADNLEWVSRKINIQRAYANGLKHGLSGEKSPTMKYPDRLVIEAFEYIKSGHSIPEASKKTGIPLSLMYILSRGDARRYIWAKYKFDSTIHAFKNEYRLSVPEKIEIVELYRKGTSPSDICSSLGIDKKYIYTIYGWISRTKNMKFEDIVLDNRLTTPTTIGDALDFEIRCANAE